MLLNYDSSEKQTASTAPGEKQTKKNMIGDKYTSRAHLRCRQMTYVAVMLGNKIETNLSKNESNAFNIKV